MRWDEEESIICTLTADLQAGVNTYYKIGVDLAVTKFLGR